MSSSIPRRTSASSSSATGTTAPELPLEDRLAALLNGAGPFSVADYLNAALEGVQDNAQGISEQQQLTSTMAELALQLQLQTQSCHEDIGRISAELHALLPRCAADVGRIGKGLEGLQLDVAGPDGNSLLSMIQQHSTGGTSSGTAGAGHHPSTSLETLGTLHALQTNLKRTQEILTAAATWDATLQQVSKALSSQNVVAAVKLWKELESGEQALRGMPRVEERKQSIAKIRSQVLQLLQPQLQHALTNMTTRLAPLQQCVSLYRQLGSASVEKLVQEYVKIRPAQIHKMWFDFSPKLPSMDDDGAGGDDETGGDDNRSTSPFLEWLPSWFDAVLSLIGEERRQSQSIFGAAMVPEITAKVLSECFRPILPSFKTRLETICSSNTSAGGPPNANSLEGVCAVYESTLQFLALVYEAIAGAWLDMVDASLVKPSTSSGESAMNDWLVYQKLTAVFLQVTSPFRAYQEQLPLLEQKYNSRATKKPLAVDASNLQNAVEELRTHSAKVFPVAEGAVARFELLRGGYGATQTLGTVDQILSDRAEALAVAVRSLKTDGGTAAGDISFDESQVYSALQVLQMSGSFAHNMDSLQDKTRERLSVLSNRIAAHAAREKSQASDGSEKFSLPDALSAVEIDSIVTKAVCGNLLLAGGGDQAELTAASTTLLTRLSSTATIFPQADQMVQRLAQCCQTFVFDVCSAVPRHHLQGVSSLSSWKEGSADSADAYGTLPQTYINHVGEHILALVQALEPFASDPTALSMAKRSMNGIRSVAVAPWRELITAASSANPDDAVVRTIMDGKDIRELVDNCAVMEDEDADEIEGDNEAERASAEFCNSWLDVVGLAITGRLLERILRIPSLTTRGCEHLNADVSYLVNVLAALGVSGHPHPLLGHFASLAVADADTVAERISRRSRADPIDTTLAAMEERLAAIRGVASNF